MYFSRNVVLVPGVLVFELPSFEYSDDAKCGGKEEFVKR